MPYCSKCQKTLNDTQFYTYKNGEKTELCKKCLTMHVDNFNPDTFLWLLEKMDVPYVPAEWNTLRDRAYAKDPYKMNGMSVFGKYLSKMKLKQWSNYSWKDTETLCKKDEEKIEKEKRDREIFEEDIKQQYEEGKITEAQYRTMISTETLHAEAPAAMPFPPVPGGPIPTAAASPYMSEDELIDPAADLTQEDKIYLAMKWGRLYKPNEWVELERKYNEMMDSFDIQDSDTIGTLILICKTYLKMNTAIDIGDTSGYQQLSRVYDSLRKSAKFTAAQNKEKQNGFVDCVGNLVAYCEKQGGKIPKFKIEADLDIVDKVIRDMKDYTKSLVCEDTALARQIEEYIKRKEMAEITKREKKEAEKLGVDYQMTDDDIHDFVSEIDKQIEFTNLSTRGQIDES